nr:MAG TPA: hypothetical protein [Caudoviricetes sp.]
METIHIKIQFIQSGKTRLFFYYKKVGGICGN